MQVFGQQPRTVWVQVDEAEVEIPFAQLQTGDRLVVTAGQMIPVDGVLVQGVASIDQHMLTGEAQPAEKSVGDAVLAATLVLSGKIVLQVEKTGEATTAAQIVELLNNSANYTNNLTLRGVEIAIQGIGRHPAKGQRTTLDRPRQQSQPDFWLALRLQLVRHPTGCPLAGILERKPPGALRARHEQLAFHPTVTHATGIVPIDTILTVRHFAHRTTVLRRHAHRVIALFHYPQFINQRYAIRFAQRCANDCLVDSEQRCGWPRTLTPSSSAIRSMAGAPWAGTVFPNNPRP